MTRRKRVNRELRDHLVISQALKWWAHPDFWWCHIPNGEYRDGADAAKLKCMGVQAGVPDFMGFHKDWPGKALFVEYKPENGRLHDAQKKLIAELEELDVFIEVAYGKEQMCEILKKFNAFSPENQEKAIKYILETERVGTKKPS